MSGMHIRDESLFLKKGGDNRLCNIFKSKFLLIKFGDIFQKLNDDKNYRQKYSGIEETI